MAFCVIHGSLYWVFSSAISASWPLEPQLPTAAHDALQQVLVHGLEHVRLGDGDAERDRRHAALTHAELVHLLEHQLGVGDHGRQEEQQVRARRADFLHQRGRIGERRGEGFIDDEFEAEFLQQALAHRLDRGDRRTGVVGDDRNRLGLHAGGAFGHLDDLTGSDCSACEPAVAEVWNTYLKPRSVIRSE